MKRILSALGALVLVAGILAYAVWQRPDPPALERDVELFYSDGTVLWAGQVGSAHLPVVEQVFAELADAGLSREQARAAGVVVTTTIDRRATEAAVRSAMELPRDELRYSVTAVDPASGGVRVYASGDDASTDYAGGVLKQPGTAFQPFAAVAALQAGKPIDTPADVVGVAGVVTAAHQAGMPQVVTINGVTTHLLAGGEGKPAVPATALGLGDAAVRPLDLAGAYATFAADGVQRRPHFVTRVTDHAGAVLYQAVDQPKPAFATDSGRSKEIAGQVTALLKTDTACGGVACRPGVRLVDGSDQVRDAWMAGYTPDLATVVYVGGADTAKPVEGGAGVPAQVWRSFREKLSS